MKNFNLYLLFLGLVFFLFLPLSFGKDAKTEVRVTKEKVVRYKENQEVDLSGSTVAGKIRTPEIFYIFQRKRSSGEDILKVPSQLDHMRDRVWQEMGDWQKKNALSEDKK